MMKMRGLTLLELLVVLMLVGLLSTLLMQGFGFMLSIYHRVNDFQHQTRQDTLSSSYFSQSIASLAPQLDSVRYFEGDSRRFTGISFQPLSRSAGTPVRVTWSLVEKDGDYKLVYAEEQDQEIIIDKWRADEAKFRYMTFDGRWLEAWPMEEEANAIPRAIELLTTKKRREFRVVGAPRQFLWPQKDYRDQIAELESPGNG